jgi:Ni,Fe-hydrogenase I cytochrome b subunit
MNLENFAALKPYLSFFHPVTMWVLLALAFYTLYLGVQVRRTRLAEGEPKKELIKGRFAVRHHQIGSIFLALIVMGAIGGITVTYINNGKIFIGPHLFAGLGMVGLVSTSAALVPFMQKHNWVRSVHVSLNMVLLGLFGWQALTGIQIVQNILSKMGSTPTS